LLPFFGEELPENKGAMDAGDIARNMAQRRISAVDNAGQKIDTAEKLKTDTAEKIESADISGVVSSMSCIPCCGCPALP
jgi:hypothetical protein